MDCQSFGGWLYCVSQLGYWWSSPLTTQLYPAGGWGNWTYLGRSSSSFNSVAESCGVVGSRPYMACITQLGWEYTFPLNVTGGTGQPNSCVTGDWFGNQAACSSVWEEPPAVSIVGGSGACIGFAYPSGLECQGGISGSPPYAWLNDTMFYPVNSTGGMTNGTIVGSAFGASLIPKDAEVGFYLGASCVYVGSPSPGGVYCYGGTGTNSTSGSPYPAPFTAFGELSSPGFGYPQSWSYLHPIPQGIFSPGHRIDAICCSASPASSGSNVVIDPASSFIISIGGVTGQGYPFASTNSSYSFDPPGSGTTTVTVTSTSTETSTSTTTTATTLTTGTTVTKGGGSPGGDCGIAGYPPCGTTTTTSTGTATQTVTVVTTETTNSSTSSTSPPGDPLPRRSLIRLPPCSSSWLWLRSSRCATSVGIGTPVSSWATEAKVSHDLRRQGPPPGFAPG